MIAKQSIAARIGAEGCYYLSIVHIAEGILGRDIDVIDTYIWAVERGYILEDCLVVHPDLLLATLIKGEVVFHKEALSYIKGGDDIVITRYERATTGHTYTHFVVGYNGKVEYDPLGDSNTVRYGRPVSYRVFTIGYIAPRLARAA